MKSLPILLTAASLLAPALAFAQDQPQPIVACRTENRAKLNEIHARFDQVKGTALTVGQRTEYNKKRNALLPKPGGSGTLADCKNKTAGIAKLEAWLADAVKKS